MRQYSLKQIWITLCVSLGSLTCGFAGGWSAPTIPKLQNLEQSPLPQVITENEASWIGSCVYLGVLMGPHWIGFLSNTAGRKPCLFLGGIFMAISYIILATAVSFTLIIVGRVTVGIACGIVFVNNLVYITEIASTPIRGILQAVLGIALNFGVLLCYSIAPYVSYSTPSYIGLILSVFMTACTCFVPDTPVFYLLKGNEKRAKETLAYLGRTDDIGDLVTKRQHNACAKQDWIEIFTVKNNRKTLLIIIVLLICQSFSGACVLIMFSTTIFGLVESSIDANISTIITGVTMLVASCITPLIIDKYGRRPMLLVSTVVCGISMMLLGLYFYLNYINHWLTSHLQLLPVSSLVVFSLSFNCGFSTMPSTLMGEMFESNVRGPGSTVTLTIGWFASWLVISIFGYMITNFGIHTTFWVYSGTCFFTTIFTAIFVPETKGKTFAEIQCMLSK